MSVLLMPLSVILLTATLAGAVPIRVVLIRAVPAGAIPAGVVPDSKGFSASSSGFNI